MKVKIFAGLFWTTAILSCSDVETSTKCDISRYQADNISIDLITLIYIDKSDNVENGIDPIFSIPGCTNKVKNISISDDMRDLLKNTGLQYRYYRGTKFKIFIGTYEAHISNRESDYFIKILSISKSRPLREDFRY